MFPAALAAYRANLKPVALICLLVYVPVIIIDQLVAPIDTSLLQQGAGSAALQALAQTLLVGACISIVFEPLASAAMTSLAYQHPGKKAEFTAMLDASLLKWPRHFITALMYFALVLGMMFAAYYTTQLFFPIGILIIAQMFNYAVLFTFYCEIVAISDLWGPSAFLESRRLVRGQWRNTALFILMLAVMMYAVSALILAAEGLLAVGPLKIAAAIALQFLSYFVSCYFKICISMYFLELRKQSKNSPFDIHTLRTEGKNDNQGHNT
ncbi:MAG: hypothetical protein LBS62_08465 [Clostridiales bacterium]|nr:hypothetical protein [Clostridiales bacterium]